ncbi:WYL domain-containing protein [Paenibacillus sp. 1P07SE]|uniref:WYL domain-containing protein n=1 Tax=Paenibacillus sp. 1P07SE TaxID=3132209 RepID=UPI0039A5E62B
MAREQFDKEIQFLRMLAMTGGSYSRQQYAQRLGISVHTFDKMLQRLKTIAGSVWSQQSSQENSAFTATFRYSYYDTTDPLLLLLFQAKSVKATESRRLAVLLEALRHQPQTALELLDCCSERMSGTALPDEKTIRSDLRYLEASGVISRLGGQRPYRYRLKNELAALPGDQLLELYDYVDLMASTRLPSVHGYLLRDSLKKLLLRSESGVPELDVTLYKYHYYSRILDEAHVFGLIAAMRRRCRIRFLYFSPKSKHSYSASQTNPRFQREPSGREKLVLPLQVVYDHQFGRWYLLAHQTSVGIVKFRLEGMTQLTEAEVVPEAEYAQHRQRLLERIRHSWLIDTGKTVRVKARFYHPGPGIPSFVKERVELQGQWGELTEEAGGESFRYEIDVNDTTEIKPWLRSFGSSCEVLEPLRLREEMIAEWKEIAASYEPVRENHQL